MTRSATEPRTPDHYSLWLLTIAPTIWAAHLLFCYITAAIWCAKFVGPGNALGKAQNAITWYTIAALVAIALTGWEGFRRHRSGTTTTSHHLDSVEDRHRFIGFATLLLAGLSAVGVLYAALAATYFDTCR
jgi:hypothetical protein